MSRKKGVLILCSILIFVTGFVVGLYGQNNLYDRIGINVEHGRHGAVPEENIDLYTGNLTLRYQDISLPGPNGLNLSIWRVYNSKLYNDIGVGGGVSQLQHEPYSWVGMGWIMHMGRVHNADANPTIEYPDGRWDTAYPNKNGPDYVTKDFKRYSIPEHKLNFLDGTVWTFDEIRTITYVGRTESVRLLTKIENSLGQSINVTYKAGLPVLDVITDAFGRTIRFINNGNPTYPKLTQIIVKNSQGADVTYNYAVETFSSGYFKLSSFLPPELVTAATFAYNATCELSTVNTCYRGTLEFAYADQNFFFDGNFHSSRVVSQKKIKFEYGGLFKTWNYIYPSYQNTETGTVTVDGPDYDTYVTYNGYISAAPWKTGLLVQKTFSDNSLSETYDWTPQEISVLHWVVINKDMGAATAPLLLSKTTTRLGDSSSKEEYLYERDGVKKYGLATRVNYYGQNLSLIKNYRTLKYYFEDYGSYETRNLLSFIGDEGQYSHDGILLKQTQTHYYEQDSYWGAIDWIKRLRSPGELLTWDYTYDYHSGQDPSWIIITVDLPGSGAGVETNEYRYGVLSKVIRPGAPAYTELERTISAYDSSISSETNQHRGIVNFEYDNLGRIKKIDLPSSPANYHDINASWMPSNQNTVVITQGSNTITKYWDGMGRDLGFKEVGDSLYLYSRKILDSEGRVIEESKESKSSTDPSPYRYIYLLNAAGQPTKITDPLGNETDILYTGNVKTVTDAKDHVTRFEYAGMPGLVTKLTDAQNRDALYSYDDIGRLIQTIYDNARTQTWSYDGLDNVRTEAHPETGEIAYVYNDENNLSEKTWADVTSAFVYNAGNQLVEADDGTETITYEYDNSGRVSSISSNLGWSRDGLDYNPFGSLLQEAQTIPGLGSKTLTYAYDAYNILSGVTYPDGKTLAAMNNGLKMPETVTFNGKSIVSAMTYGHAKKPEIMTVSGNATALNRTYNMAGYLTKTELKKSSTVLYDSSYGYDGVGNITSLTATKPLPVMNAQFGYDELNRLTSAAYTANVGRVNTISYTYDHYGNMLSVQETGLQPGGFSKTYNEHNQIDDPVNGFGYDARGNLTSADGKLYYWDHQNRLTQIRDAAGQVLGDYRYNERGLRIYALPPAPEMVVKEGGTVVTDGGNVSFSCAVGSHVDKTLTIHNIGDANLVLSGTPFISITGPDQGQFSVQQQPTSPVLPGGSIPFTIRFEPSSEGTKAAAIAIANNDADKSPYEIALTGTNPIPEITITQDGANIPDGGSVSFSCNVGAFIDKTFSIKNDGGADLTLSGSPIIVIGGTNADQFSVQQQPASPVAPSGTTEFKIRFQPTAAGTKTATISIANNDGNENPFDIALNGQTPQPEISIDMAEDGGTYDFGTICVGDSWLTTFTIYNSGDSNLVLSGSPLVRISGQDLAFFSVEQQPDSVVAPGQYTTFDVLFTPLGRTYQALLSITSNDADESPYEITLTGTGDRNCPPRIGDESAFVVTSPGEGDTLTAGSEFEITWKGPESSQFVNIEISADNGSTYRPIAVRIPNTGRYPWKVGETVSPSCLLRISDADGPPVSPQRLIYEFMVKVSRPKPDSAEMSRFSVHAALRDAAAELDRFADVSFVLASDEFVHISANMADVETLAASSFLDQWRLLRIQFDPSSGTASFWIDDRLVLGGFPLNTRVSTGAGAASSLSFSSKGPIQAWIEDLDVGLQDRNMAALSSDEAQPQARPLIWEGFNHYAMGELPGAAGWTSSDGLAGEEGQVSLGYRLRDDAAPGDTEKGADRRTRASIDGEEFVSCARSLKLDSSAGPVLTEKAISIPDRGPFGISEGVFAIVEGAKIEDPARDAEAPEAKERKTRKLANERDYVRRNLALLIGSSQERTAVREDDSRTHEAAGSTGDEGAKILSAVPPGSYYIYSYDGKLMAEYNGAGQLVRDYIYIGGQLVAEYQGGTTYFYYATDQVNSTRAVTNGTGSVVYSVAYDPYGGVQKTWGTPTYTPALKFSGKERDAESGLDYFGARYHASFYYRWISVDPIVNKEEALANPQLWNLYSFCRANPVSYWDPDGRIEGKLTPLPTGFNKWNFSPETRMRTQGTPDSNVSVDEIDGKFSPRFKYDATAQITLNKKGDNGEILEHEQQHMEGFEWLYYRNRDELIKAEGKTFESRQEALDYGQQVYKDVTSYRPFKWNLYRGDFNPLAWLFHKQKWASWADKKDWN